MSDTFNSSSNGHVELPSKRLSDFITLARQIEALVPNSEWDTDVWNVGSSFATKGQNRNSRVLAFYNREATLTNRQKVSGGAPLSPPFKEFSKAYIRFSYATAPGTYEKTSKRLHALQFIEAGFRSLNTEPRTEHLTVPVLNAAVYMAGACVGPGRHYQLAVAIQQIYRFCLNRKFLVAPFEWRHGVKKPTERTQAIDEEAKDWRDKKLPSPEAYLALAYIYRNAEPFIDRLYSAIVPILVSVPIRLHELLQLRVDCEVFEKVENAETGKVSNAYGIRVHSGKGNPPQVKWVPSEMASLVQEAITRIREMCAGAREISKWYEQHPDLLWLPETIEQCRSTDWMSLGDVARLTGVGSSQKALQLLRNRGVPVISMTRYKEKGVHFSSFEKRILRDLPREFPYLNGNKEQKYSETLMLLFLNQGHAVRSTNHSLVQKVTVQSFSHWLTGHDGGKKPSVFERWNFTERNGAPIRITSYNFRHWLNTLAQLKGMNDLDISKWSGRNVLQNEAYNHVTPEEALSQIRAVFNDGGGIGPMFEDGEMLGINQPVDRKDFAEAQIGAALATEFGICVHDYSLLPCQAHGDCLRCTENVFIKGDLEHRERIKKRLLISEKQLDDALSALDADHFGADRWVRSHQDSIVKMREMLDVHNDPAIPNGTTVSLRGALRDSEVAMALRDRESVDTDNFVTNMWEC